jgi:very-short-patch-repair endonuclease
MRFGIPVTSVPRTIADLREGDYEDWWVRRAIRQAEFRKYRVGIRTDRSRSDLERDFLAFFRRQRFPEPEVNVKVDKWTVDFLWREARVAVETDFFDYHRGSVAFEDDHERDLGLRRLRLTVFRYTGDQLDAHPDEIAAELSEALRVGAAWQPTRPNSS